MFLAFGACDEIDDPTGFACDVSVNVVFLLCNGAFETFGFDYVTVNGTFFGVAFEETGSGFCLILCSGGCQIWGGVFGVYE